MVEKEIYERLKKSIVDFDDDSAEKTAKEVVSKNFNPLKAVNDGLVKGLDVIGEKYENDEICLCDFQMAAKTFQHAMETLEPAIKARGEERTKKGVVVFGTVKGDIHKIGKDIVILLMRNAGYEVHDLGEDVDLFTFIETANKINASLRCFLIILLTPFEQPANQCPCTSPNDNTQQHIA